MLGRTFHDGTAIGRIDGIGRFRWFDGHHDGHHQPGDDRPPHDHTGNDRSHHDSTGHDLTGDDLAPGSDRHQGKAHAPVDLVGRPHRPAHGELADGRVPRFELRRIVALSEHDSPITTRRHSAFCRHSPEPVSHVHSG